jgi:hypothetical protein
MTDNPEIVAQLRPTASDIELRSGWVAEEIRWDGADREIAYDPARFRVLRAAGDSFDPELRALFVEHGWRRFGVDSESAELWVRYLDQTGVARLDRLSAPAIHADGTAAAGPDAVEVA